MLILSPLFFGFLAAASALVAELFVFSFFPLEIGGVAFLAVSALIEEILKYTMLRKTLDQDEPIGRLMFFLVPFGIGFSALEITLLLFGQQILDASVMIHIVGIFLIHLATISMLGFFINRRARKKFLFSSLCIAAFIHLLYNIVILHQDALHI